MTNYARIGFDSLGAAARIEPVILLSGIPVVLTVGGTHPTATAVSSGTVDPLWWPGTGTLTQTLPAPGLTTTSWDPVRDLLDPFAEWRFQCELDLVKGELLVEPLSVDLLDTGGAATALCSRRAAAVGQLLAADMTDTDVNADLASVVGATAGVAHIGREAVTYLGVSGNQIQGIVRGRFGSKAVGHRVARERPPVVTFGEYPRYVQGRRALVFLCRVSADGATLYDPTLVFSGIVGAGVQLVANGTRWQLPLDPVTEILQRAPSQSVTLSGWMHDNLAVTPLRVQGGADVYLDASSGLDGYHHTREEFLADWNRRALALSSSVEVDIYESRWRIRFYANTVYYLSGFALEPAWAELNVTDHPQTWLSTAPAPADAIFLNGTLRLSDLDHAKIPSVLSYAVSSPARAMANFTLHVPTRDDDAESPWCMITARDAGVSPKTITVLWGGVEPRELLERTAVDLGVISIGDTAVAALKALALGVDALCGGENVADLIDWEDVARVFAGVSLGIAEGRRYVVRGGKDSVLSLLSDEARLRGCVLSTRRGRVSVVRVAQFAASEDAAADIDEADLLVTGEGAPLPLDVVDQPDAPATTVSFTLADGREYRYTDATFASEFGGSDKAIECAALRFLPLDAPSPASLATDLPRIAQPVLGVVAEPQRVVSPRLGQPFLGLEAGDLVRLTHTALPNWSGTRGVTGLMCQVESVERTVFGGRGQIEARLRFGDATLRGYAPEALVAAGGLSGGSAVVTLDTSSAFGASCFAPPGESPAYGFAVGDVVVLSQYDSTTITVTEIQRTITAIDTTAHTVTLDSAPSAGMVTQAAGAYGVVLRTAAWTAVTADQQSRSAFVADDATEAFSDSAAPHRWGT